MNSQTRNLCASAVFGVQLGLWLATCALGLGTLIAGVQYGGYGPPATIMQQTLIQQWLMLTIALASLTLATLALAIGANVIGGAVKRAVTAT